MLDPFAPRLPGCPLHVLLPSRPEARRTVRASRPATSSSTSTARPSATSSATRCRSTSRTWCSRSGAARHDAAVTIDKAAGAPLGAGTRQRGVRPGAHLRQPLPVLLHLPTPEGHAQEPVPQGRRLPPVAPLRKLHHPDPLHRGGSRAGDHRGSRSALRVDPRDRSRCAHRAAAESPRRDEPALARLLLDAGVEVHGQIVVCPGINDGAVLDDTLLGILDRFPAARDRGCGAARRLGSHHRARHAPAHPRRGRAPCWTSIERGRRASSPRSAIGWCSRPTSTTSWPTGRSPRPTRTRDSCSTRTASAWPGPSQPKWSPRPRGVGRRRRCPLRFLRLGRRCTGAGLPRAPYRRR